MYVEDCSEAIRRVAEDGQLGEVYNIGTDFEMTNIDLTRKIHDIVNKLQKRLVIEEILILYRIMLSRAVPSSFVPYVAYRLFFRGIRP